MRIDSTSKVGRLHGWGTITVQDHDGHPLRTGTTLGLKYDFKLGFIRLINGHLQYHFQMEEVLAILPGKSAPPQSGSFESKRGHSCHPQVLCGPCTGHKRSQIW